VRVEPASGRMSLPQLKLCSLTNFFRSSGGWWHR